MHRTAPLAVIALLLAASCSEGGDATDGSILIESATLTATPSATEPAETTEATPPVEVTPAAPKVVLSGSTVAPGSTVVVTVRNTAGTGTVYLGEREFPLIAGDGYAWAVVGLGPDMALGGVNLNVQLDDGTAIDAALEVVDAGYPIEDITLSGETSSLLTPENSAYEASRVREAYAVFTAEKLWQGPFIFPVDTYITSVYGEARSYNGGPISSYHKGIDFGALEGTPIQAANRGRVILAEELPLSGNSVVVDHGLGVMTFYCHMVQIGVEVGQMVETGALVGGVGATGIATGSHLHWGVLIRGVPVNPHGWTWVEVGPS